MKSTFTIALSDQQIKTIMAGLALLPKDQHLDPFAEDSPKCLSDMFQMTLDSGDRECTHCFVL